jgi:hypothetical protein
MITHRVPEEIEKDFIPAAKNYCSRIIATNKEADDLLADGFSFGAYELNLRASLDKDVLSFCLFIDKEFAHVSCLADNPRGKSVIDPRPFSVDYQHGEVVVGRAMTVPKFRRLHLQSYNGYILRKYCRERGIDRIISSVNAYNIPALAETPKAPDRHIKSRCRLIRILWFNMISEIKTENTILKQAVAQITSRRKKH